MRSSQAVPFASNVAPRRFAQQTRATEPWSCACGKTHPAFYRHCPDTLTHERTSAHQRP